MDIIFIEKLTTMAMIGIYDWEKNRLQKLIFDLKIGWENQSAICSGDVKNYLNYVNISDTVISLSSSKHFALIENLAEEIANRLITQFEVPWIQVKISKPSAIPQALNVGIIIERGIKYDQI